MALKHGCAKLAESPACSAFQDVLCDIWNEMKLGRISG
jgi:hypothetical protein